MAKFSISLLLFVILGGAHCGPSESCKRRAYMTCRKPSTESAFENLGGKFPGEAFLKENCDSIVEQLDCLLEQKETCPMVDLLFHDPDEIFHGLLGLKQLVDDICDEDSSLRKDYIQTIGCFDEHKNELKKDVGEIDGTILRFNRHYYMQNGENSRADKTVQCVKFAYGFNRVKDAIEKHCGPAASNVFVTIANYLVTILPDQCLGDQENFDRLTKQLESFRPSDRNVDFNSIE